LAARGRWREVGSAAGPLPALLPPGQGPGPDEPGPRMAAVPAVGQHTDAVLGELGLSSSAIAALREARAI
jgi:crotonobetainyl-CoA:carnitine CoA-transferase CaiB-like acyl-CoA transferase